MDTRGKHELRIGKKVIAETPSVNIDSMVDLVNRFRDIRCDDTMWEPVNDTLPCFAAFEKTLKSSGLATADIFDVFDKCSVWSVLPNGDSVKVITVWNKGF